MQSVSECRKKEIDEYAFVVKARGFVAAFEPKEKHAKIEELKPKYEAELISRTARATLGTNRTRNNLTQRK